MSPSTRRSTRVASGGSASSTSAAAPSKRKADDATAPAEKTEERPKKTQKTLEETLPTEIGDSKAAKEEDKDAEMKDDQDNVEEDQVEAQADKVKPKQQNGTREADNKDEDRDEAEEKAKQEVASHANDDVDDDEETNDSKGGTTNGQGASNAEDKSDETAKETLAGADAVEQSSQIEKKTPSTVLEKGLIYFFSRSRIGISEPEDATDLQRTFFVLRPLPVDATLGSGALPDSSNNRLFALPKKVFPKSHTDKFMTFVEKSNVTLASLKEDFMTSTEYSTKTQGDRVTPAVTPIGEGVYALTHVDNTSHLAYMLTIPSEIGPVQEELGIAPQGSFQLSTKNPTRKGPANASLDSDPGFPKEVIETEFHGLAWIPSKPHHLDYASAQFLLIGEGEDLEKATKAAEKDDKDEKKVGAKELLEELENADEKRVDRLAQDDSVYKDLHVRKQELDVEGSGVRTTW